MAQTQFLLALSAAVGSGLIAGVFFAFSTFVMKALARRPPDEGIAAMQAINVVVINPVFLALFAGLVPLCLGTTTLAIWMNSAAVMSGVAGSVFYVVGTFGVTVVCNVPLNNQLASVSPKDESSAGIWVNYIRRWTFWNHVRTIAGAAASAAFVLAAARGG